MAARPLCPMDQDKLTTVSKVLVSMAAIIDRDLYFIFCCCFKSTSQYGRQIGTSGEKGMLTSVSKVLVSMAGVPLSWTLLPQCPLFQKYQLVWQGVEVITNPFLRFLFQKYQLVWQLAVFKMIFIHSITFQKYQLVWQTIYFHSIIL